MIKQFIRKILCRIDFWFYIHKGKPLTKIKYFKKDVPNKYWGKCLLKDTEVAPYYLVFCKDPKTIKVTEKDREWARNAYQEHFKRERKN
ncbi:MAG: hypothetical protein KAW92_10440 [Candidatus Cloacimonetes bacterium]|nr:hypothetical protein [Candidatus Cloacimonadota bacterium]